MTQAPETQVVISAPSLVPYSRGRFRACAACGISVTRWGQLRAWMLSQEAAVVKPTYCAGGKQLADTIHSPIEAMMRGRSEVLNECAGIGNPHLHMSCNACGAGFLMAVCGKVPA